MRAAVYRRFGGPETVRVEEVPRPSDAGLVTLVDTGQAFVGTVSRR
jgi:NADPH:quinone reductase-like Zn-dependent oxidoreductase